MTGRLGLGASLVAAALLTAACAGGGTSTAAATQPAAAATAAPAGTASVSTAPGCEIVAGGAGTAAEIKGFAFPTGLTVKAGDAIAWTNGDTASHTVTFDDGTCASGTIGAGTTVVVRYNTPGTFAFHCAIHATMTGTIEVKS